MLCDKAFNIAKNLKYDGSQCGLASMVYKFFAKKSTSLADKSTCSSGIKPLHIRFVEIDGFIKIHDRIRNLVLFGSGLYDAV